MSPDRIDRAMFPGLRRDLSIVEWEVAADLADEERERARERAAAASEPTRWVDDDHERCSATERDWHPENVA